MTDRMKAEAAAPAEKPEPTDAEHAEVRACMARAKDEVAGRRASRWSSGRHTGPVGPAGVHADAAAPDDERVRHHEHRSGGAPDQPDLNATHLQPPGEPVSAEP